MVTISPFRARCALRSEAVPNCDNIEAYFVSAQALAASQPVGVGKHFADSRALIGMESHPVTAIQPNAITTCNSFQVRGLRPAVSLPADYLGAGRKQFNNNNERND